ncbi:MAG: AgmX/PglI C-terminal domain-containing protein [Pseudomonadota bacterium]|nr:AgmX/PglI C-terminal domain-containing protein [Pseudomonadota bacterium]
MSDAVFHPAPTGPVDDTLAAHVLDVLLRATDADPGADRGQEKVLEVAQVFGDAVVDLKHFAPGRAVQLGATLVRTLRGTRMQEDFFLPTSLLPTPSHPLFEAEGRGWVCVVHPAWDGFVEGPSGRRSIPALAALVGPGSDGLLRIPVGSEDRAVVIVGGTTFVARPVHPSKRVPLYGGDGIDYPMLGIAGFIGFAAMFLGIALSVIPAPPRVSAVDDPDRLVKMLLDQMVVPPPMASSVADAAAPKAAPKGPEGDKGRPDSKAAKDRSPLAKANKDQNAAEQAGVLGALNDDPRLASMLGDAGLPGELSEGIGGLVGPRATQNGNGGLGSRRGGFGGGGTAQELGGFGPRGRGPGGNGFAPTGGVKDDGKISTPETSIVMGGLDRSQIDEVVKRSMSQIRYCYQRELTKNPGLGGKVTVKFTIAGDGSVSSAITKASTLANPAVESCINGRFLRMGFPSPKGNGLVIVSYPFLFSPG